MNAHSPSPPRVLILGGMGMLGHQLYQAARPRFDTWVTVRGDRGDPRVDARVEAQVGHPLSCQPQRVITGIDATRPRTCEEAIARVRPHVIVNAIGVIKQRPEMDDPVEVIQVNALFPHLLARQAAAAGARLIHLSTDCVFSGTTGGYRETDLADASDLYGRSKLLGELTAPHTLTLRTSMIGRELSSRHGLVEWFLGRRNQHADGFTQAIFSGLTTPVLAALIVEIIERHTHLAGIYHVAAAPIDKCRLLGLLDAAFGANVRITPRDRPRIDRSLDGSRFRDATGFVAPDWQTMIGQLARDPFPYDQWRLSA
jgi:dTDP-4-dehydrorhamnose reductase